jgi:tetratricopeptide (TPR) repeat protein
VRRELQRQSGDATHAEMETVDKDIKAGLVTVRSGPVRITALAELDRTTSDSMAALSAGLRAVAPDAAEGLAVALDLALPAQRGWRVRTFPTIRGSGADAQVGLSVEVVPLGRAPDAVTTFWRTSEALQRPASNTARLAAMRELLRELLHPASMWIAIQLVARHLAQAHGARHWLLPIHRTDRELTGLQLQLAGQLSLYATWAQKGSAGGFVDQALKDLDRAAELLPKYYRPRLTKAAIYERRGWSYRQSGEDTRAQWAFTRAVDALNEAEQLLGVCGKGADKDKRDGALDQIAIRRTKCRLLSGEPAQAAIALQELAGYSQPKDTQPVQLYNTACLFAVAMACPYLPTEERELSEWRAWYYLCRALVLGGQDSAPWKKMTTDEELDALDADRRVALRTELKKRHNGQNPLTDRQACPIVEGAMEALGLTDPVPSEPVP